MPPRAVLNQLDLVTCDFDATLAFYRKLGVDLGVAPAQHGIQHAEVTLENGFVLHLDNFAARYVAAEPERRAAFETQFWIASGLLFFVVGVLRRHGLPDLASQAKETADGQV